jgi:hypothetical protein
MAGKKPSYIICSIISIADHFEKKLGIIHDIIMRSNPPQSYDGKNMKTITGLFRSHSVKLMKFKRDLITWIAVSRQTFVIIEEPKFIGRINPQSINIVRNWISI